MKLSPGALIANKYRLDRQIGVGGMGEVWSAHQQPTNKLVALKFLKARSEGDTAATKRFLREARAVCAVRHPNVVEVHDVLELDEGWPVMVMEFLDGESLEQRLASVGKLPFGEFAAILARTLSAVEAAHEAGIVHRDLKPDNIFLSKTSVGTEVKVLDFGIAKVTAIDGETAALTNTGAVLGTPYYMAPEQAFGEKRIDHRADIWSLGIILYRGLTGVLPTRADNLGQILKMLMTNAIRPVEELAPSIPDDLKSLIGRMLSLDPNGRPSHVREVLEVVDRYAGVETADFGEARATTTETLALSATRAPLTRSANTRWLGVVVLLLVGVACTLVVVRLAKKHGSDSTSGSAVPALGTAPTHASGDVDEPGVDAPSALPVSSQGVVVVTPAPSATPSAAPHPLGIALPPKPISPAAVSAASAASSKPPTPSPSGTSIFGVLEKPTF